MRLADNASVWFDVRHEPDLDEVVLDRAAAVDGSSKVNVDDGDSTLLISEVLLPPARNDVIARLLDICVRRADVVIVFTAACNRLP